MANLRVSATTGGPDSRAATIVARLSEESAEFEQIRKRHDVTGRTDDNKTIVRPELGHIDLQCQILFTQDQGQALLVFTGTPGTEGHSKMQMLSVIGTQQLTPGGEVHRPDRRVHQPWRTPTGRARCGRRSLTKQPSTQEELVMPTPDDAQSTDAQSTDAQSTDAQSVADEREQDTTPDSISTHDSDIEPAEREHQEIDANAFRASLKY